MKKFIKVMAYILALPVAVTGYIVYEGLEMYAETQANISKFEDAMAEMNVCGEGDEAAYNANPVCQEICDSFFQCRNDYLILEEMVENEYLSYHEDVYTDEEYELFYGKVDSAENIPDPGNPPQPILD